MFSSITSVGSQMLKVTLGRGLGLQGKSPHKVKLTGSPLEQPGCRVCPVPLPRLEEGVHTSQCAQVIRKPPGTRAGLRRPAPPPLGKGRTGLTEAITGWRSEATAHGGVGKAGRAPRAGGGR